MKIAKIRENVTRSFVGGEEKEIVDNASYELRNDDGVRVGEMTAYNGGYSININGTTASIDEAVEQVKAMFNIKTE